MAEVRPERRRASLARRIGIWVGLSTAAALLVFAVVAFFAVAWQEREGDEPGAARTGEAESESNAGEVLDEVLLAMAVAAPVGLALAVGGAVWITRRALRPVDDVIAAAGDMTAAHLDRRLPVPPGDDELGRLVTTLNRLFARLEQGHAALGRFADEASHELRTPLAVVASELEVALRRPRTAEAWEETARTTLDEVRRLAGLVGAMLRLARADAAPAGPVAPVDMRTLVETLVQRRAATTAREGGPVLVAPAGAMAAWVQGDAEALSVALSNLLDNAVRYATAAGRVTTSIERGDQGVRVHIDDTGPGVPPSEREAIFVRYARGIGARDDGAGLGLAIARRIAEQYGGSLVAGDAPGGGARFTLALPTAEEPQ